MTKTQMPQMPSPIKNTSDVAGTAPASISPTLGAPEMPAPSLDLPATLIPGTDPNPAGLAENPHVEDPKAIQTELDKEILKDFQDESGLGVPTHSHAMTVDNGDAKVHSQVVAPKPSKDGYDAIATRAGFYKQERLVQNDPFKVEKWEDIGDWFIFVDPDLEKKRKKFIEEKKARKV